MGMLDAIAASLGIAEHDAVTESTVAQANGTGAAVSGGRSARPILQLNRFPVTLDAEIYRKADKDKRSLFAFRELVDPVPAFTRSYSASDSTEAIYEALLNGAIVDGESEFAAGVLSEAKRRFQFEKFAYIDGRLGEWRPVYAVPDDWYDAGPERFQRMDIDLSATARDGAFAVIGGDESLELRVGAGHAAESGRPSSGTRLRSIRMEYLLVVLRRPWLNPLLFDTNDWFLSGEDAGFCSSGSLIGNRGVLPLIPTAMLIGRSVDISAEWSEADASLVREAQSAGKPVSLGPFLLSAPESSTLHVIGWTSNLVPFSPKMTRKSAGSILVDNSGAFIARFFVEWNEGAERRSRESVNFPVFVSKEIPIPLNATKIVVKIDIMTFPTPFETWKTVATLPFDKPVVKRYSLSGKTWDPVLKET